MSHDSKLSAEERKLTTDNSRFLNPGELSLSLDLGQCVVIWQASPRKGRKHSQGDVYFHKQQVYRGSVLSVRPEGTHTSTTSAALPGSCLVQTHKHTYLLVTSSRVTRFRARAPITCLASTTRRDTLVQWAEDAKHNFYLFDENTLLTRRPPGHRESPYVWFDRRRQLPAPVFLVRGQKIQEVVWHWASLPLQSNQKILYVPYGDIEWRTWIPMAYFQLVKYRRKWAKSQGFFPLSMKLVAGKRMVPCVGVGYDFEPEKKKYMKLSNTVAEQ